MAAVGLSKGKRDGVGREGRGVVRGVSRQFMQRGRCCQSAPGRTPLR
uniref:Uncharacterized protein n=1 Tax=Anguilla anguilla TaxID=7936 RepID=A0A0E9WBL7_ANGAN